MLADTGLLSPTGVLALVKTRSFVMVHVI
jgi:hypothetical protein